MSVGYLLPQTNLVKQNINYWSNSCCKEDPMSLVHLLPQNSLVNQNNLLLGEKRFVRKKNLNLNKGKIAKN